MKPSQRQQLWRQSRRANHWQSRIKVIMILLLAAFVMINLYAFGDRVDYTDDRRDDYNAWEQMVLADNYIVAKNIVTELSEVSSSPRDGAYGVAYAGTISVGGYRSLLRICEQAGINEAVVVQATLPNGVLYWGKLDTPYLRAIVREADWMYMPDNEVISFETPPQAVQLGLGAWLHAKVFRLAQNWMVWQHDTANGWLLALFCITLVVLIFGELVCLWAYYQLERVKRRCKRLFDSVLTQEDTFVRLVSKDPDDPDDPSVVIYCTGLEAAFAHASKAANSAKTAEVAEESTDSKLDPSLVGATTGYTKT